MCVVALLSGHHGSSIPSNLSRPGSGSGLAQRADVFGLGPGQPEEIWPNMNFGNPSVHVDDTNLSVAFVDGPSLVGRADNGVYTLHPDCDIVPEPSTYITWAVMGLVGTGLYRFRRKK